MVKACTLLFNYLVHEGKNLLMYFPGFSLL